MSVKNNTRYMTLREALKFFDLDYKMTGDKKIQVFDIAGRFDYEDFCDNGEEALDYGIREVMVDDYFYKDEEIIPSNVRDMNLEEIYNYYIDNGIENSYMDIIGAVSGRIPVVVEEWSTEENK